MTKTGRNQLCPCGSGKKYKHCHGSAGIMNESDSLPDDIQQSIEKFYREAEDIVNSFAQTLEAEPAPKILYHYTNDTGLRGILETGRLWLTDIFNLNDPTELKYGLKPAIGLMEEEAAKGPPEVKLFARNMKAMLLGAIEEVAHYFVCCFSRAGDDLGQWRAYADNGRGYALGFDGPMLEQAFTTVGGRPIAGPMTFPVTYGDECLHKIQQQIISKLIPLLSVPHERTFPAGAINKYMSELSISLSVPLLRSALFFKHKAYSNEQEYRFMHLYAAGQVPDLKFRSRPHSLIRYKEFDWKSVAAESVKEIVIGPAADRNLALPFVTDCLRAFHPRTVPIDINQSEIPYRAV